MVCNNVQENDVNGSSVEVEGEARDEGQEPSGGTTI